MASVLFRAPNTAASLHIESVLFNSDEPVSFIDTAIAFTRQVDPSVDHRMVRQTIEDLASQVREALQPGLSGAEIMLLLADFIYNRWGFSVRLPEDVPEDMGYYDTILRFAQDSPQDIYRQSFLVPVLEYREGNCLGLTSLYLALAEALDLPIFPVYVPYHVFPRFDDGTTVINVEATARGIVFENSAYIRLCRISKQTLLKGIYLRTLPTKEVFSAYYLALGSWHAGRGLGKKAQQAYRRAVRLSPQLALAYSNLAFIYAYYGISTQWMNQAHAAINIDPFFLGGYLSLSNVLFQEGRMVDAIDVLKQAVAKHPAVAHAHAMLGEMYLMEGYFKEAEQSISRAIQLAPREPNFHASMAKVAYFKNDYLEAEKYAARAKQLGLKDSPVYAMLKRKQGQPANT